MLVPVPLAIVTAAAAAATGSGGGVSNGGAGWLSSLRASRRHGDSAFVAPSTRRVATSGGTTNSRASTPTRLWNSKTATEFMDPLIWKPKCPNWEVIDWERFESTNPKPPQVYNPPQIDRFMDGWNWQFDWWSGRSPFLNVGPIPFNIVHQMHMRIGNWAENGPRKMGYVSEDDMFIDMLRPEATSPTCPDVLRGVMWTRDNIVMENVVTFQNWAWKSCAVNAGKRDKLKNPNGDGVIGVGSLGYNWTNDGSFGGIFFALGGGNRIKGNVQMSPSGKWIVLAFGDDFSEKGQIGYHYIYVVQEGDNFEVAPGDEDGDDQHRVKIQPGDLMRVTFDETNPYSNSNDDIFWHYLPRRIATWDDATNSLVKVQPDFDDYRRRATSHDIYQGPKPILGLFPGNLSVKDKGEYVRKAVADRQYYSQAPRPPTPEQVDHL